MPRPDVCELLSMVGTPRGLDWDQEAICDEAKRHIVYLRRANLALHLQYSDQQDVIHELRQGQFYSWLFALGAGILGFLLGFHQGSF